MRTTYALLYAKTLDNPAVMKSPLHFAVWGVMLLLASRYGGPVDFNGKTIDLAPGQFIAGRNYIRTFFKLKRTCNESVINRVIKCFKTEHLIEQQPTPHGSIFTIVNWMKYQKYEQQDEQQVNNKRTTSEQQVNTIKKSKRVKGNTTTSSWSEEQARAELDVLLGFWHIASEDTRLTPLYGEFRKYSFHRHNHTFKEFRTAIVRWYFDNWRNGCKPPIPKSQVLFNKTDSKGEPMDLITKCQDNMVTDKVICEQKLTECEETYAEKIKLIEEKYGNGTI
jgi:hypothetical protein